jgi:hydrogenase maturation protease
MKNRVLILGIGNYLMGDEGLGVHVARELTEVLTNEPIDVVDGGTGGFQLLELLESYPTVILVDATLGDRTAGTIRLIEPKFSADFPKAMSTHEVGLKDLVESLVLLDKLPKIFLFVVSIEKVQPLSIELSMEIKQVMPLLKEKIILLATAELEKLMVAV